MPCPAEPDRRDSRVQVLLGIKHPVEYADSLGANFIHHRHGQGKRIDPESFIEIYIFKIRPASPQIIGPLPPGFTSVRVRNILIDTGHEPALRISEE